MRKRLITLKDCLFLINILQDVNTFTILIQYHSFRGGTMELTIKKIIEQELLYPVYQPIFRLYDGEVYGYEGLIRGPKGTVYHNPVTLFNSASKHNMLVELEYLARRIVISNYTSTKKLFLNVNARVFENENLDQGRTIGYIQKNKLHSENIVIELTEYANVDDKKLIQKTKDYRDDYFQIAIDDFGIGSSDIKRFMDIKPNILKIDKSLITNIEQDHFKKATVKAFIEMSQANGIKTVAEGIETKQTLSTVIKLGIDYGQGYYLSKEQVHIKDTYEQAQMAIRDIQESNIISHITEQQQIQSITQKVPSFHKNTSIKTIDSFFNNEPAYRSIPIVNDLNFPVGLITRYHLNMLLSRQYGRDIYLRKQIYSIMDKVPLIMSSKLAITDVAEYAMNRELSRIYQDIIIRDDISDEYLGVVTIRDLLNHQIQIETNRAKNINPLTNLPGNATINEKLNVIHRLNNIGILYFDLNHFKYFNDMYGFEIGDKVLLGLSHILKESITYNKSYNHFLGHIGGDDFIAIVSSDQSHIQSICSTVFSKFEVFMKKLLPNINHSKLTSISAACLYIKKQQPNLTAAKISNMLTGIKKKAKKDRTKNTYVIDCLE